jgi:3-oxoadipate enol-lactonase/4-carboxymuconolactone decarboxylase
MGLARVDGPRDAPPLVLLNSIGSSGEMWDPVVGALAEEFLVVRVEYRAADSLEGLARGVVEVLDELELERVHLAGLSLGGMVGMWLAARYPERIGRMALLCTSAWLPPASYWLERADVVSRKGLAVIWERVRRVWITEGLAERDPGLVAKLEQMFLGVDSEDYVQCCRAIAAMDLRAELGRISSPTVVLSGVQDPATPPEHGRLIADGIAGARLELLDAAHLATVEQPGRIVEVLLRHFGAGATLADGYRTRRAVLGDAHVDRATARAGEFSEPFQEFITRYAWGDVWSRPGLSHRDRSIATLAALVTLGAEHELAMHVRAALRNGVTREEIRETLLHTALYAGLPRANRAFALAEQVLDQDSADGGAA